MYISPWIQFHWVWLWCNVYLQLNIAYQHSVARKCNCILWCITCTDTYNVLTVVCKWFCTTWWFINILKSNCNEILKSSLQVANLKMSLMKIPNHKFACWPHLYCCILIEWLLLCRSNCQQLHNQINLCFILYFLR